ncbi:MAG TPA: DUF4190 domain-containing protein, partial [Microbacterium sp.]|nr:DUF4190 domain-containing protein [Microbacterium sp.]
MSDSQIPGAGPGENPNDQPPAPATPLPSEQASPTPPPAPPAYQAAPTYAPVTATSYPGKTLGIVALVLSCIFFLGISVLVGLILGIVARVQSSKAGYKNGPALAAIIVGAVLTVVGIIAIIVIVAVGAAALSQMCTELGPGIHH